MADTSPEAAADRKIWGGTVELGEDSQVHVAFVATADTLYFAKYDDRDAQRDALDAAEDADDPAEALGQDGHVVPFTDILRVEKIPNDNYLRVHFLADGDETYEHPACPDEIGEKIFKVLKKRLAPRLIADKEQVGVFWAISGSLGALAVIWLMLGALLFVAWNADNPEVAPRPGQMVSRRSEGIKAIARFFGVKWTLVMIGVVTAGFAGWMAFQIARRPLKKVLVESEDEEERRPRKAKRRDEDEEDEPRPRKAKSRAVIEDDEAPRPKKVKKRITEDEDAPPPRKAKSRDAGVKRRRDEDD